MPDEPVGLDSEMDDNENNKALKMNFSKGK
jgi:hypothetical protein